MDAIFVGIDVSKDRLDVHVRPSREAFAVARDGKSLEELIDRLRALEPQLIAIKATGGFETIAAAAIAGAALPLAIVNPAQVRHFAQAVGKRAKTDPLDAEVIAHFAEAVKPPVRPVPDEQARLLADLVARRRQIIEMIVAERQREKRAAIARVRKGILRHVRMLEKELLDATRISARWCVGRRPGARRRDSWLQYRAWAIPWRALFSPNCPSSAGLPGARSQAWQALLHSRASPAAGKAKA